MNLSKFLKSAKWANIAFWVCMTLAVVNIFNFFVAKQLDNRQLQIDILCTAGYCVLGAVLNYFRLPKDKK